MQIGELLHHFGGEVGLAKVSRALGVRVAAQLFNQFHDALGLFEIRTQLGLKRDVAQILDAVGEFLLLIDVPEEAGVVEAGFEDAFIAALDQALGIAAGIHHRDEVRASLPGADSTEKYFWWCRITVVRTSAGSSR